MTKFVQALHDNPDKPILEVWKDANAAGSWLWGAVVRESSAKEDTLRRWDSKQGLPEPTGAVLQFDYTKPGGRPVEKYPPAFEAVFVNKDGVQMTWLNNTDFEVGLRGGEHWNLVVKRNDGQTFAQGDVVRVVFAHFRFTKSDMNLNTLLQFDAGAPVTLKTETNKDNKEPHKTWPDGVDVTISKAQAQIELGFTVKTGADTHYKGVDGSQNSGLFRTRIYPPGANFETLAGAIASPDGVYLWPPKKK
jgi:hypothetical protein